MKWMTILVLLLVGGCGDRQFATKADVASIASDEAADAIAGDSRVTSMQAKLDEQETQIEHLRTTLAESLTEQRRQKADLDEIFEKYNQHVRSAAY